MDSIRRAPAGLRGWFIALAFFVTLTTGTARCGNDPIIITTKSETITSAEGGEFRFLDAILIFAPGDLASDTEITINLEGKTPQGSRSFTQLYSFEPEGLVFANPIKVCFEFKAQNPNVASTSGLFWTNLNSASFSRQTFEETLLPYNPEENIWRRCAIVSHFSQGYLGNNTDNPNGPSDADLLFQGIDVKVDLIANDRDDTMDDTFTDGESYEILVDQSGSVQLPGDMANLDFQFDPNIDRFETEFTGRVAIPEDGLMATIYREWGILQVIRVADDNPQFCLLIDDTITWDFPEDAACVGLDFGEAPDPDGGGSMTGGASSFFSANAANYMYVANDTADSGDMTFTETNTYSISVTAGGVISVEDDAMNTISFTFDEMTDTYDEAVNETNVIIVEGGWQVIMQKPTGQPVEFFLSIDPPMIGGPNWHFAPAP
ncbi:MAG: hypothetical protein KDH09_01210 [Chrysiogenetes bacterium]|nr:hypothetical protein [Chrysiogenetes bacterium]